MSRDMHLLIACSFVSHFSVQSVICKMKPDNASDSGGKSSHKHNEHKEEFCGYW